MNLLNHCKRARVECTHALAKILLHCDLEVYEKRFYPVLLLLRVMIVWNDEVFMHEENLRADVAGCRRDGA